MPQILKTLSQLLELKRPMLTTEDLAALPEDLRATLLNEAVLVPASPATHLVCNACHEDHAEEVVRIKHNGETLFRIPCPEAGWVDVAADHLRQWTLDSGMVAAMLARCISPKQSTEELLPRAAWRIGSLDHVGENFDVVFIRTGGTIDSSHLDSLSRKCVPARTVLISAGDMLTDGDVFAAEFAVSSAFELRDGQLVFQAERVRSALASGRLERGNVFQRRGELWQLSFDGQTKFFKDSVGLGYISRLLSEPNRYIPAVTLHSIRTGIDASVATGSSGPVLDDEARRNYERRYHELEEELDTARKNQDLGQTEKFEAEIEQLATEVARATGVGGRPRENSDMEKVRTAVSMAVSRALDRIRQEHEPLGRHLTAAISSGRLFRYAPERETVWLI